MVVFQLASNFLNPLGKLCIEVFNSLKLDLRSHKTLMESLLERRHARLITLAIFFLSLGWRLVVHALHHLVLNSFHLTTFTHTILRLCHLPLLLVLV